MTETKYLSEIQGLRTVAALLVAIYHIWFQRVSGGVDVFFVVASYFMTLSLLKVARSSSVRELPSRLAHYYTKTMRRVLPSLVVVVVVTSVAVMAFVPSLRWNDEFDHALASLAFVENLHLAILTADYLATSPDQSMFQQFWALSLQVQFYLAWPALLTLLAIVARGNMRKFFGAAVALSAIVAAASFAWATHQVSNNVDSAYFLPQTRAWEFAFGSLVALGLTRLKMPRVPWRLLGWAALAVLLFFAAVFDASTQFPGPAALVPVLSAALLIAAAVHGQAPQVLASNPLIRLAPYSFAFYLWHWPILIGVRKATSSTEISLVHGLIIVVVAWVLAFATTELFEKPFRGSRRLERSMGVAVMGCVAIVLPAIITLSVWNGRLPPTDSHLAGSSDYEDQANSTGGVTEPTLQPTLTYGVLDLPFPIAGQPAPIELIPPPEEARSKSQHSGTGCHQDRYGSEVLSCVHGEVGAATTVVLVGGSHSLHWFPALDLIGKQNHFEVISMTKGACVFGDETVKPRADKSCMEWQASALAEIIALNPNLVVTLATRGRGDEEVVPQGYVNYFKALEAEGVPVLALRDNPWLLYDGPECAALHMGDLFACSTERSSAINDSLVFPSDALPNVTFVDTAPLFCDESRCYVTRGDFLMYQDEDHITRDYIVAIAGWLESEVLSAL